MSGQRMSERETLFAFRKTEFHYVLLLGGIKVAFRYRTRLPAYDGGYAKITGPRLYVGRGE